MQGTFNHLTPFENINFQAYRLIKLERFAGLAAFALAMLEVCFKFKGLKKAKDLIRKFRDNFQAVSTFVQDSEQSDLESAQVIVDTLNNADYTTALKWLEIYATQDPGATKALIVWMKATLKMRGIDCTENAGVWDSLQVLADEFEVRIEKEVKAEDIEDLQVIYLHCAEDSDVWYILYKAKFLSFIPRPESSEEFNSLISRSDKIIDKLVSVLSSKTLSASSLSKLEQFYKTTQDKRVASLISSHPPSLTFGLDQANTPLTSAALGKSVPHDFSGKSGSLIKCLSCKKPLPTIESFTYFCRNHPQCPSCFDPLRLNSSCKLCKNYNLPKNLSLLHLLSATK